MCTTCYDDEMIPQNVSLFGRFALVTLICAVCGCKEATQIDCQIVGHSMATAYKSEHSVASCDQCGCAFACDVVDADKVRQASIVCGNCGCTISSKPVAQTADQVTLNPGQPVNRWDVVAFRRGDRMLVKRVIGLPGEVVDFAGGNLMIDGEVAVRPKPLWKEISSSVFDSRPSTSKLKSLQLFERLVPREKEAWGISEGTITHRWRPQGDGVPTEPEFDFLDYRHLRCYKTSEDVSKPAAIDDANPFNQSIRRTPHPVDELDVRLEATFAHKGSIQIDRQTSKGTISAKVELREDQTIGLQLTSRGAGAVKTLEKVGIKFSGKSAEVRLVNYDDLIHLFVDESDYLGAIRLRSSENPERFEVDASKPVVSIGVSRADAVKIERVSIWRDWYLYQDPPKPSVRLPLDTGKEGYYVVGDNLPVSEDSRHFGVVHDILGVVKPADDN